MSLQDELLKAGLVSTDKAKKQKTDQRKRGHERKKNKKLAAEDAAQQAEARQKAEAEVTRKREEDRRLNQAREAEKKRKECIARAQQLIQEHRLNDDDAEIKYNFLDSDSHQIRAIRVLPSQCKGLAAGQLAIVRGDRNELDFVLVSQEIAKRLAEFAAERILVLYPESDGHDDLDWDAEREFEQEGD